MELKEFYSTVKIEFAGNNHFARNEREYLDWIKAVYYEEYGIKLDDSEITVEPA